MLAMILAAVLPPNVATWYTAHVCRELPQFECWGWNQLEQARRCDEESPLACVSLTHTSTNLPFVGTFDGEGLVALTMFAPKGPKTIWSRAAPSPN